MNSNEVSIEFKHQLGLLQNKNNAIIALLLAIPDDFTRKEIQFELNNIDNSIANIKEILENE